MGLELVSDRGKRSDLIFADGRTGTKGQIVNFCFYDFVFIVNRESPAKVSL